MGRARDISKVFSTGTALATDTEVSGSYLTLASASTTYQTKTTAGLTLLTPTSIANTSGTASIGANGTITFSAVSTVSLNDVFSTTYDNYKIVMDFTATNANDFNLRFRLSGSDNTDSQYQRQEIKAGASSVSATRATSQTSFRTAVVGSVDRHSLIIELFNPFLARFTGIQTTLGNGYNSTGPESILCIGGHNVASSFTGISLIPSSGTITGQVSVYGYNE